MYKAAIHKFPSNTALRIQYASFLLEYMEKRKEALAEFQFIQTMLNPPFDEQFVIFRYIKHSEDFYGGSSENSNSDGAGSPNDEGLGAAANMDVIAKYAYESSLKQCETHIMRAAGLHVDFWNHLKGEQTDLTKLNTCG